MLSKPDDWQFYTSELQKHSEKDGRRSIESALKEIQDAGYLKKEQKHKSDGSFDKVNWLLVDKPTFSPQAQNVQAQNVQAQNVQAQNVQLLNTDNTNTNNTNTDNTKNNRSNEFDREPSLEERFKKIWKDYPNKKGKQTAYKAYQKAVKDGVTDETIKQGIANYNNYIANSQVRERYIKHGSTFFNQRSWDDDYNVQEGAVGNLEYNRTTEYDDIF
ncbi:hypothetical protein FC36_GL001371 [Ligilactobacillus equi DSM 15833 = JCM 10991]|uniref:Phage replication protein n=2 Tax=Ligilactobacillus equi TaxID=137357 RepID=A0A0R1TT43_9LACO|nr:hypothetical protein FC36_GL001371 [Ligilactobacillus equi DSM 15833 = JCM 10991]